MAAMRLPWREVRIGDGPPVLTSLTAREAVLLARLAAGRDVLEIGSAYGYSTIVMACTARRVVAVDPHRGHGAMPGSLARMRENLDAYRVADKVAVIAGDQAERWWAAEVERWAAEQFAAMLDAPAGRLVFIDGDHRAPAVRADVRYARLLLRLLRADDGRIACHDYGEDTCPDVKGVLDALFPAGPELLVDTLAVYRP
jgi:predicted O-methyltransferase YrrM